MPAASAALASGMSITGLGIHSGVGRARSFALASAICSNSLTLGSPLLKAGSRLGGRLVGGGRGRGKSRLAIRASKDQQAENPKTILPRTAGKQ